MARSREQDLDAFDAVERYYENEERDARRREGRKDPSVWLSEQRMSQTEVGLRLSASLISSRVAAYHVIYVMAGYELTRQENPKFPVRRYLTERLGFTADTDSPREWRGTYSLKGHEHVLIVDYNRQSGQIVTFLPSGERLIVFVTAGLLTESRSPAEHKRFWQVVGRAATSSFPEDALDVIAVGVPRSERYRKLAAEYRRAEGIQRSRIHVLTVDRTGYVDGLQSLPGFSD